MLSYPLIKKEEATEVVDFLNGINVIDLTEEIKSSTIDFRGRYRLKLPDAIMTATTYSLNAELFTSDVKLLNIP